MYYILICFKYRCTDSLKMTEFCQNMYMFTENCIVMYRVRHLTLPILIWQ
jgi:hypothetical protein